MAFKDLKEAYTQHQRDRIKILDTKTMKVIEVLDDDDEELKLMIASKVQKDPDRYLNIPHREASKSYDDIKEFINKNIHSKGLQDKLFKSIAVEKGAFSRFKDILSVENPDALRDWYTFLDQKIEADLMEWLRENNIEITDDFGEDES